MNQNIINNVLEPCNDIDKGIKSKDFTLDKVSDFIPLTNKIITSLFDSILIGEFVSESINKQIQNIKDSLDFFPDIEIKLSENSNIKKTTKEEFNKFREQIQEIQNILNYYFLFSEDIQIILQNPEKDEIFTPSKGKYQSDKDSDILKLFSLNLSLCFSDFLFTEKQDCYQEIVSIKDYLTILLDNSSFPILTEQIEKMNKKATFLLFKWCKRAELSDILLFNENKINEYKEEFKNKYNFKDIILYIENHYDENKSKLKKAFDKLKKNKNNNFNSFTCQDIHLYIKYYKDIDKNIVELDKIINWLKRWKKKSVDSYEKIIRNAIYNYACNNRFSLFAEECKDKNELYKVYKSISNNDKNYFLQYKLIKRVTQLINDELKENDTSITLAQVKEIESFLKNIEKEYEKYKKNIQWIVEHIYFIYRVSFEECIIDEIFIYSSFLLPLDIRKSKNDYEIVSDDFRVLKSQIEPLKRIVQFNDELTQFDKKVKDDLTKFDEKIEKRDTKTIELMGLFTAIIAFVIGSIPTFQYLKNIFDVGIFFVVFATSLISFLLVLLFITGRIKVNKEQKWWESPIVYFLFFYIAMIIIAYVLSCFNPKDNERKTTTLQQTEKTIIEEKITSNKTVDTLKQSKITKKHTTSTKDSLK